MFNNNKIEAFCYKLSTANILNNDEEIYHFLERVIFSELVLIKLEGMRTKLAFVSMSDIYEQITAKMDTKSFVQLNTWDYSTDGQMITVD